MSGIMVSERKKELGLSLNFDATELRLGLPGDDRSEIETPKAVGKRGFAETAGAVDWKLKLGDSATSAAKESDLAWKMRNPPKENVPPGVDDSGKPPAAKAQVVGWPPVRSFRKNILAGQSAKNGEDGGEKSSPTFVKVSMDGAPYLRKVDLKMYKSYQELSKALEAMFSCFTIGMNGRDFMNESKLTDLLNGSEYVPTYEDKDGDWMLVGDVPWEMFVDSCKRLRIMKGSEAIGLAPRAVEKCKNRT
ncbi:unnamed protein product [Victoria cruziana]